MEQKGKFSNFIKKTLGKFNPFHLGFENRVCMSEWEFSRILTRILFKRLIIDVFTKLGYESETEQRFVEKKIFIFNQDGVKLRNLLWYLADAIATGQAVYIVYKGSKLDLNTPARLALPEERLWMDEQIRETGTLPRGYFVFNGWGYEEAMLVNLANSSLYQLVLTNQMQMRVASAPIIKAKDLTRNIAMTDSEVATTQGASIRDGIQGGSGAIIDADSDIVLLEPKTAAAAQAFDNYTKMISLYMGMPQAWVVGLLTSGSLNGGESDNNAIERGLKTGKLQIVDPLLEQLFDMYVPFKKDSWRYLYKMQQVLAWIETSSILEESEKKKYIHQILP